MAQKSSGFDIKRALADPSAHFAQPADLVATRSLSRSTKLKLLRQWEHDARSLAVADSEGMSGGEESMHGRVLDAIQALEVGHKVGLSSTTAVNWVSEARSVIGSIVQGTRERPVTGLLLVATAGYVVGRTLFRK